MYQKNKILSTVNISDIAKVDITEILIRIVLIVIAAIQLYPLLWLVTFSFKTNREIFGGNTIGLPEKWMWQNYKVALTDAKVAMYLFNSILVTASTLILVCFIGLMASYAIERMRWKYNRLVMNIILLGMMIPTIAALLPLMMVLIELNLYNNYLALILPYTAFNIPIAVLIFGSYMTSIPKEIEEAATIDGSSVYGVFFKIIIPLSKPALATVAIFTFLQSWNELMFALTYISKDQFKTLTVGINSMLGVYITDWGTVGAGLVITTMPIVLIYTLMSKQIQKSLVSGAVKG